MFSEAVIVVRKGTVPASGRQISSALTVAVAVVEKRHTSPVIRFCPGPPGTTSSILQKYSASPARAGVKEVPLWRPMYSGEPRVAVKRHRVASDDQKLNPLQV